MITCYLPTENWQWEYCCHSAGRSGHPFPTVESSICKPPCERSTKKNQVLKKSSYNVHKIVLLSQALCAQVTFHRPETYLWPIVALCHCQRYAV